MDKLDWKIYVALFAILGVLIVSVIILSSSKKPSPTIQPQSQSLAPTPLVIVPTSSSGKIVLTPRFTGANINIPPLLLNTAQQKQALKKKTPLTENEFTITYDYQSDTFIVTLSEPKQDNKAVFEPWLKQNYPLIPLNKFLFK